MSYQYPNHWVVGNSNNPFGDSKSEQQEVMSVDDAPKVLWVPMLLPIEAVFPYWGYPQTYYDYGFDAHGNAWPSTPSTTGGIPNTEEQEESLQNDQTADDAAADDEDEGAPAESCSGSAEQSDSFSDASTDVGDGDDIADDFEEEVKTPKQVVHVQAPARPSLFMKLSRQQRVDQLRRVIDEYCELEFDSVEATSQEALALRMLTILKSLSESATFHGEQGRSQEKRLCLLGFGRDDENAIKDVARRAQVFCEERLFRSAFDVLKEVAPRFKGESLPARSEESGEDMEAMKQRRLEKRQRQRKERCVQRAADRADRAAQRCTSASSSSATAAPSCKPPSSTYMKWSRK